MRLAQIEESIRKLCLGTCAQAEERILGDALAALAGAKTSAFRRSLSTMRMLRISLPVRLAGAAAIIAITYVGAEYLSAYLEGCGDTTVLTIELASNDIGGFFGL